MAAATKLRTCHHPLQVSDVTVQVYPALQLMQAKVLPINFKDENFADNQLTTKTLKFISLENLYV